MAVTIIDNIPRAVHIHLPKPVSVIPFLYCFIMRIQLIRMQHISYFGICKTKIFIKIHICYRIYLKVIQTGKNAFLRYSQTSCQHSKLQAVIGLQCILEQITDQQNHFLIITPFICFGKRDIILVDQNDNFFPIMLFQKLGQFTDAVDQCTLIHPKIQKFLEYLLIGFIQTVTVF